VAKEPKVPRDRKALRELRVLPVRTA